MPKLTEWLQAMEMVEGLRERGIIMEYGGTHLKILK